MIFYSKNKTNYLIYILKSALYPTGLAPTF